MRYLSVVRRVVLLLPFLLSVLLSKGQEKNVSIVPLPILGFNPTFGFAFGIAPSVTWQFGDKETTSMSSAITAAMYTTNKQLLFNVRGNAFLPNDQQVIMADIRYQITSQPTYGLGSGTQSKHLLANGGDKISESEYLSGHQMMEYRYLRIHMTGFKRYQDSRFFAGIGYLLDKVYDVDDQLLNLDTIPQQITNHFRYNTLMGFSTKGNTVSGVSVNAMYDSRDNVANPYSGIFLFGSLRINPKILGSTKSSTMLWLETRSYFSLSKERPRHMIAWWNFGWFVTSGKVPYMSLPAVGWDMYSRSGRGYTLGRFRGEDMVYSELEYRFPLQKNSETFGGVLFTNALTATSRTDHIKILRNIDIAYGVGLRVMVDKKSRSNIALDYARGINGSSGFFVSINEVF